MDVVKGGAGDFLAGFLTKSKTLKLAPKFFVKKFRASFSVLKFFGSFALNLFPFLLVNSATTLKEATGLKASIWRSLSTIKRTATD